MKAQRSPLQVVDCRAGGALVGANANARDCWYASITLWRSSLAFSASTAPASASASLLRRRADGLELRLEPDDRLRELGLRACARLFSSCSSCSASVTRRSRSCSNLSRQYSDSGSPRSPAAWPLGFASGAGHV